MTLRARGFPFGFVRFKVSRSRVLASLPSFRLPDHPPVVQACFGAPAGGGGSRLKGSILLVRCKSAAPLLASPRADGRPSPLYTRGVLHGFLLPRVLGIPPRRPRLSRAPTLSFGGWEFLPLARSEDKHSVLRIPLEDPPSGGPVGRSPEEPQCNMREGTPRTGRTIGW